MSNSFYVIGVSARRSEKTGGWFADVYTAERQVNLADGCLGGRLRASDELAPQLSEIFHRHGGGWYDCDMAAGYMGANQISTVLTLSWSPKQSPPPFARGKTGAGTPPRD